MPKNIPMSNVIGIDIGGTNIKVGIVSQKQKLLELWQEPTATDTEDDLIDQITKIVAKFKNKHGIQRVGIGIAGLVNHQKGVVFVSPHLPLYATPLKEILQDRLKMTVAIDNDVNVNALGERFFGAAKNSENFIYLTIGTGIGGAIFINGRLYRGIEGFAGEIGHTIVDMRGPICDCNAQGCLEALASGSVLKKITGLRGEEVSIRAQAGDQKSIDALKFIGKNLGVGIANVINIFDPGMVILGGKVVKSGKILFDALTDEVKNRTLGYKYRNVRIEISSLGDKAGPLGAAMMALHNL